MADSSFNSLKELSEKVNQLIDRLENGKLKTSELETLTDSAREIYERALVLRFKAYETPKPQEVKSPERKSNIEIQPVLFQLEEDAIEEKVEDSPQRSFEEEKMEELNLENQTSLIDAIEEESEHDEIHEIEESKESINEIHSRDNDETLAIKLKSQPVSDLKKAIGLNQKFRFINELFAGEVEKYEQAIIQLNNANSREEALAKAESLKEELEWDLESNTTMQIFELLERRHP